MQTVQQQDNYHFPWRSGNHVQLLVDGERFFPAMLAAIGTAKHSVLLEIYLFSSSRTGDEFIAALVAAAARQVQVYVLLDDFGARELTPQDRQRLVASGAHLAFYNPLHYGGLRRNLWRDHRKLLVVDGEEAFVGGAGITDDFATHSPCPWHDIMLAVRGPCVSDWQEVFRQTWNKWTHPHLELAPAVPPAHANGYPGRVMLNAPARMGIKQSILKRVRGAEHRIWLASAYFIPSWKIRRALYHAARAGVDVRLVLPGSHTDHPAVRHAGRRYYGKLLAAGVRIFEFQPRFLHAKILLCDHWVSLGSSNIDRWNFSWNLEANQEVEAQDFATEIAALFEADMEQSREYLAAQWHQRSLRRRVMERFWGTVELWLERFSQHRGPKP